MNIEEIYLQINKTNDDNALVELAKNEVMVIPVLINAMLDRADCRAENVLIELSEQAPLIVYPYFKYIAQALDRYNNYTAWNVWRIIANLLIADYLEMWEDIKNKYFNAFLSENIAEILVLISTAKSVAKYKPNDRERILKLVKACVSNNFKICGEPAPHINEIAKQADEEFFENLDI